MTSPTEPLTSNPAMFLPSEPSPADSSSTVEYTRHTSAEDQANPPSSPLSSAPSDLEALQPNLESTFKLDSTRTLPSTADLQQEVTVSEIAPDVLPAAQVIQPMSEHNLVTMGDWQPRRSKRIAVAPRHHVEGSEVLEQEQEPSLLPSVSMSAQPSSNRRSKRRLDATSTQHDLPENPPKRVARGTRAFAEDRIPARRASPSPSRVARARARLRRKSSRVATSTPLSSNRSLMVVLRVPSLTQGAPTTVDYQPPSLQMPPRPVTLTAEHLASIPPMQPMQLMYPLPPMQPAFPLQPTQPMQPMQPTHATYPIQSMDEDLIRLSKSLTTRTALENKPGPKGQPMVWADDRSSLCETAQYYRAYQGACYSNSGKVFSMMFDESCGERDFMDAEVIVSRAGGGMAKNKSGKLEQVNEQTKNAKSISMHKNIVEHIPIVVICGDKNPVVPSRMPHRYNVLGFFKVTDIITSVVDKKRVMQYRFEKLNPELEGWWDPVGTKPVVRLGELDAPMQWTCSACDKTQEQVYLQWMCLESECSRFWKLLDGSAPQTSDTESFNPRWLKKQTRWENEQDAFHLHPNPSATHESLQSTHPHGEKTGLCCPKCGMCISRFMFNKWACQNAACDFKHVPLYIPPPLHRLRLPDKPVGRGNPFSHDTYVNDVKYNGVKLHHKYMLNHRVNDFTIQGLEGNVIVHMIANQVALEEPHGPDDMMKAMQEVDLGLERRYLRGGKDMRMSAFSVNHGFPYKFVGSVPSRSFADAPWVIKETRTQLNFFSKTVLKEKFPERAFNELLTFGYLEGQKINYHDDGETGLGPTVATYSLGAPAWMRFRMKGKYWFGVVMKTRNGIEIDEHEGHDDTEQDAAAKATASGKIPYFLDEEPLPNTMHYTERKSAYDSMHTLTGKAREKRCRELCKELGLKSGKGSPALIHVYIAHGDKVIMHGEALQKYFEHEVEPIVDNGIRFANTCREILPHHLPKEQLPAEADVPPDTGDYDGSGLM